MVYPLQYSWAFFVAQLVKNLPAVQERPGFDPWVGKIPWRRKMLPTPVFRPGEFNGLYSPWGRKELDTTELLLEKGLATHSNTLAWRSPWREQHGRPQSMYLQSVYMTQRIKHQVNSMKLIIQLTNNQKIAPSQISATCSYIEQTWDKGEGRASLVARQ